MTEVLTESFCERCGTKYTFEGGADAPSPVRRARTLARGLRYYLLSDDPLDEALAEARRDDERDFAGRQLDAFHKTFSFCIECRQYVCGECWNEAASRCLTCAPMPGRVDVLGLEVDLGERLGRAVQAVAPAPATERPAPPDSGWPSADLVAAAPQATHEAEAIATASEAGSAPEIAAVAPAPEAITAPEIAADAETAEAPTALQAGTAQGVGAAAPTIEPAAASEMAGTLPEPGVSPLAEAAVAEAAAGTTGPAPVEPAPSEPASPLPAAMPAAPVWRIVAPDESAPPEAGPSQALPREAPARGARAPRVGGGIFRRLGQAGTSPEPQPRSWGANVPPAGPRGEDATVPPPVWMRRAAPSEPPAPSTAESAVWEASARGVLERPGSGVQSCVSCGLPLSATARFCRRCGSRQG